MTPFLIWTKKGKLVTSKNDLKTNCQLFYKEKISLIDYFSWKKLLKSWITYSTQKSEIVFFALLGKFEYFMELSTDNA